MIRNVVALILIVGTGVIHGKWTNRWGGSTALAALAERFDRVPMIIGDWKATTFELGLPDRTMAGASACLARVYTNSRRGISVSVLFLCGLPGDMSKHPPDVCYQGFGYTLDSLTSYEYRYNVNGERLARFRTAVATRGGTNPSVLRIYWGWNASKVWAAPAEPRWTFASESTLCKLYVVRETAGATVDPGVDPCNEFLRVFLPELDRLVFLSPN